MPIGPHALPHALPMFSLCLFSVCNLWPSAHAFHTHNMYLYLLCPFFLLYLPDTAFSSSLSSSTSVSSIPFPSPFNACFLSTPSFLLFASANHILVCSYPQLSFFFSDFPKSLSISYINLAHPGTLNLVLNTSFPTFLMI